MIQTLSTSRETIKMNRALLIAILVLANAIPVAFFGMKVFDAINPRVLQRFMMAARKQSIQSDLDEQIERMRKSLEAAAAKHPHDLKAIEARRKALEELLRERQEEQKRLEEQKAKEAAEEERRIALQLQEDRQHQRREDIMLALGVVVVIFILTLGILWMLKFLGGPLKAEVKAVISKFGGKLWITAAGLVGAFLAIAIVGVGSVYLLASFHH